MVPGDLVRFKAPVGGAMRVGDVLWSSHACLRVVYLPREGELAIVCASAMRPWPPAVEVVMLLVAGGQLGWCEVARGVLERVCG